MGFALDVAKEREGQFPSLSLSRFMFQDSKETSGKSMGFTLIELMVAIAIIGILIAIAIPNYLGYKQAAYTAIVKEDVRNVALAEEAYYATYQNYIAFGPITGPITYSLSSGVDKVKVSRDVTIRVYMKNGVLTITGTHPGATSAITYSADIGTIQ